MAIQIKKCVSIDYAVKSKRIEDFYSIFDNGFDCASLFFPPNNKTFPDLLFISNFNYDNSFYCLISIQHKLYSGKVLDDRGFPDAIRSTSIDHFFEGHDKKKQFPKMEKCS